MICVAEVLDLKTSSYHHYHYHHHSLLINNRSRLGFAATFRKDPGIPTMHPLKKEIMEEVCAALEITGICFVYCVKMSCDSCLRIVRYFQLYPLIREEVLTIYLILLINHTLTDTHHHPMRRLH